MELHVSLCAAVHGSDFLEYIPQLTRTTTSPLSHANGLASPPSRPGLGIAWDEDAIDDLRRS